MRIRVSAELAAIVAAVSIGWAGMARAQDAESECAPEETAEECAFTRCAPLLGLEDAVPQSETRRELFTACAASVRPPAPEDARNAWLSTRDAHAASVLATCFDITRPAVDVVDVGAGCPAATDVLRRLSRDPAAPRPPEARAWADAIQCLTSEQHARLQRAGRWIFVFARAGDRLTLMGRDWAFEPAAIELGDGRAAWATAIPSGPLTRALVRGARRDDGLRPIALNIASTGDQVLIVDPNPTCVRFSVAADPDERIRAIVDGHAVPLQVRGGVHTRVHWLPASLNYEEREHAHTIQVVRHPGDAGETGDTVLFSARVPPEVAGSGGTCFPVELDARSSTAVHLHPVRIDEACADAGVDRAVVHQATLRVLESVHGADRVEDTGAWTVMATLLRDFESSLPAAAPNEPLRGRLDSDARARSAFRELRRAGVGDLYYAELHCLPAGEGSWEYSFVAHRLALAKMQTDEQLARSRISPDTRWATAHSLDELRDVISVPLLRLAERPYVRVHPFARGGLLHYRAVLRVEASIGRTPGDGEEFQVAIRSRLASVHEGECEAVDHYSRLRRDSIAGLDSVEHGSLPLRIGPDGVGEAVLSFLPSASGPHRVEIFLQHRGGPDAPWATIASRVEGRTEVAASRCLHVAPPDRHVSAIWTIGDRLEPSQAQPGHALRSMLLANVPVFTDRTELFYRRFGMEISGVFGYSYAVRESETAPSWDDLRVVSTDEDGRPQPRLLADQRLEWTRHSALLGGELGFTFHLVAGLEATLRFYALAELAFIDLSAVPVELTTFRDGEAGSSMFEVSGVGLATLGTDFPVGELLRLHFGFGFGLFLNAASTAPPTVAEGVDGEWMLFLGGSL